MSLDERIFSSTPQPAHLTLYTLQGLDGSFCDLMVLLQQSGSFLAPASTNRAAKEVFAVSVGGG